MPGNAESSRKGVPFAAAANPDHSEAPDRLAEPSHSAATSDIATEKIHIPTEDGYRLAGKIFRPARGKARVETADRAPKFAAVLHPATGVEYYLYEKFAQYLASRGWAALVYDFRGTGQSAQPQSRTDASIRMSDWMLSDVPAATKHLKSLFPHATHFAIGHSVGAHGMIATQSQEPVDAMVMIASHAGVTATVRTRAEKAKIWSIFNLLTPVSARLLGYVPVDKVGIAKQIPVGVMRQWSRWTRKPAYFFDDAEFDFSSAFAQAKGPLLSVVFSDDLWANRRAVDILTNRASAADVDKLDIEAGPGTKQGPVGHMGFYRSKNANLWPTISQWLEAQTRQS